ncbi:MAG: ribonuclease J [Actinobacteria bacterium]|nr:ribonuclease J [Actinomycetota bacterium]
MTAFETAGRIVVVDTGLMFPAPEQLGIDLVLPDFAYLRERAADIEAIVLTHGHEDHVGALPYVLRELAGVRVPPVYGGPLTVELVRSKLDEHHLLDASELVQVEPGEPFGAGPFTIETVRLAHSIPDSCGVALSCDLGTALVTGDYKFDQTPVDGQPADMARLAELGREGLLLLCGDSTNVDRPGIAPSESSVGPHLEDAFTRCPGRIVVTSFASNVHRVQQVIDAAEAVGRKVSLVGRSMRKNVNIARQLGHITLPEGILVGVREVEDYPDHKLVVISTGSQGEPLSALRRMAHGDHPHVDLHEGDTVLFSATPIPGNERAVNETINRIYQLGADVVTARDAPIHASGHGYAEELKLMINLTSPEYVLPMHGDHRRLRLHGELAESVGVPRENVFRAANGVPLEIDARGARLGKPEQAGMIFVDGLDVGDVEDVALRDRRMLSADGIFIVVATVSEQDGRSVAPPELIFRGVPFLDGAGDGLLDELRDAVEESLARSARDEIREISLLQDHLHDDVARYVYERLRRRPMVLPVVVEV